MLSRETAESLLTVAERSGADVALPLLASLVRFGLHPSDWADLGDRVAHRLTVPAGAARRAEHLVLLANIPNDAADHQLLAAATDSSDPDWLLAVRLAGPSARVREALASSLAAFLQRHSGNPDVLRAVACLPLHEYGVDPVIFQPAVTSELVGNRLWAAVALAKLGQAEPLRRVLDELPSNPPGFMDGDPWTAYDVLAAAAPLPLTVRETVKSWHTSTLERNQYLLVGALTGAWDAENEPVVASQTSAGDEPPASSAAEAEQEDLYRRLVDAIESGDADQVTQSAERAAELDPRRAGSVLTMLCLRIMDAGGNLDSLAWGNAAMDLLGRVRELDLPVDDLVDQYLATSHSMHTGQLGAVLARADHDQVTGSVVRVMATAAGEHHEPLAELLNATSRSLTTGETPFLGAGGATGELLEGALLGAVPPAAVVHPAGAVQPAAHSYTAYPQLTAPDVVVARVPFDVTIGLAEFYDSATAVTGPVVLDSDRPKLAIEVELVVDPASLKVEGEVIKTLEVSPGNPYPTHRVTVTAVTDPRLSRERTMRLLVRRDGVIVGMAKRVLVVVDSPQQVAATLPPPPPGSRMLALDPLLKDAPPDVVIGVYKSDQSADVYVWDVYPLGAKVRLQESERRSEIDMTARDFAGYMKNQLTNAAFRGRQAFLELAGYGDLIQGCMPPGVRSALRDLVAHRATAPSVLFLTEEPFVPWELAVLRDPPLTSTYAGSARFLGAHLAMSRWPSDDSDPPPAPAPRLGIEQPGVLTAKYDGVPNWPRLPAAEAEAAQFVEDNPTTLTIEPRLADVQACLEGTTPVDLLHVALHGQFDPSHGEDGLVLLEPDGDNVKVAYLTALAVRGLRENTARTPFVFLNACQVGAADKVLGSYAGFASAVLRTKACGVVAPLWNIDDTVAAKLSRRFYEAAFAAEAVPVAEVLRQIRAEFTLEAVEADPDAVTPTYVAYQFFGHPRFTLERPQEPTHG